MTISSAFRCRLQRMRRQIVCTLGDFNRENVLAAILYVGKSGKYKHVKIDNFNDMLLIYGV